MDTAPAARDSAGSVTHRTNRPTWTIGRRLAAGYAAVLLLMAAIGLVSYANTGSLVTNSGWVEHTHEVLTETDGLLAGLTDAEPASVAT